MSDLRLNAPDWMKKEFDMLCKKGEQYFNDSSLLTEVGTRLFLLDYYPDEALYYLKRAVEVDPSNVDAQFWLSIFLYYDIADYIQAEEVIRKAVRLAPQRADCLSLLAYVIKGLAGPTDECMKYLKSAITLAPNWTLPRQVLIQYHIRRGEYHLAQLEFQQLTDLVKNTNFSNVVPTNKIEEYYENCVTGRLSLQNNIEALERLTKELAYAKQNPF